MLLYDYLEKAKSLPPFDDADRKELSAVLTNPAIVKLIRAISEESNALVEGALGWNLMGPAGVADAANSQGRARGLKRALDIIWDMGKGE